MNFPVGNIISENDSPYSFENVLTKLEEKKFNGYIIQTISGNFIEEGILFFREGNMFACSVECKSVNKLFKGSEALNYFLNQTKGVGSFHIVELSRSQVDLITAFDEKLILTNKIALKDIPKMIPLTFKPFEAEVSESKLNLDDYGLGELK